MYEPETIALAVARGYDHQAHLAALAAGDSDAIALTHPANWLKEDEVEALPLAAASEDE